MRTMLIAAAVLFTISATNAHASTASLVTFGDSLVDSNNARLLTIAGGGTWNDQIYPNGQFTNGDTWATQLGLGPSLLGGSNFAYGGARAIGNDDPVPDLLDQIKTFKKSGIHIDQHSVAAVWVGGNDFLALPDDASDREVLRTIGGVIGNISKGVRRLARAGFEHIEVFGQFDFGLLPGFASDPADAQRASLFADIYNGALKVSLAVLDRTRPADINYFDVDSIFDDIIADLPDGLVSVPCLAQPLQCAEAPTDYLLYDTVHPSAWVHSIIAERFVDEIGKDFSDVAPIPLPATAPLLLVGLGGGFVMLRRRKSRA